MAEEIKIENVGGEGGVASEVTLANLVKAVEKMSKSEGLDPKKSTEALKKLNKEIEEGVEVVTENRDALEEQTEEIEDSTKSLKRLNLNLGSLALNIAGKLTGSIAGLTTELISGGNDLSDFARHIPIVGGYLGDFTGFLDGTFDTFRDLSSSGASFNNSMQQLMVSAAGARMPLDEFAGMISRNTEALAAYGGTVTQGAMRIKTLQDGLGGMRDNLLNMGMTFEEINEGLIQYQYLNRSGSRAQQQDQAALAQSAGEYMSNLNKLSKLTGQSVQEMQQEMQQRNQNAAFQMKLASMSAEQRARVQEGMATAMATGGKTAADRFQQMVLGVGPLTDETRMLASAMPGAEQGLRELYNSAMNASSAEEFRAAQQASQISMIAGVLESAETFEGGISAAAAGLEGPAATLMQVLNDTGVDFTKYAGLQGRALEDAIAADLAAAEAENNKTGDVVRSMAAFDEAVRNVKSALTTAFVESGFLDKLAVGIEKFATFIQGFGEGLSSTITAFNEGTWWNGIVTAISEGMKGLWNNKGVVGALVGGIVALMAAKAVVGGVSNALSGAVSRAFGRDGGSDAASSSPRSRANAGRGAGNAIGNIGKGIGKGLGGILKGLAGGIMAFANPAVALGAAGLSASIVLIGGAIAGATWMVGKSLPTMAEGLKSFESLDGAALIDAGKGMAAVAAGMAAFGAGSAVAGLGSMVGSITEGIGSLFGGEDPMDKLVRFASYDIDADSVENNARAMVAFSTAMAASGGGAAAGGIGAAVGAIGSSIAGFFGGETGIPYDDIIAFQGYNFDAEKVRANADAIVAFNSALTSSAGANAASSAGNAIGAIGSSIASFFGGETGIPYNDIIAFQSYNFDAEKVRANADAIAAFNSALTSSAGASAASGASNAIGAIGNSIASFFGADTPFDQVKDFGAMDINAEGVKTNAEAMVNMANALSTFSGSGTAGDIEIPDSVVSGLERLSAITGTGLTTTATGLQMIANTTGLPEMVSTLNSLDANGLNSYNTAMEKLVDTLEELNKVLAEDNSGMLGGGTGVSAATMVGNGSLGGGSGMSSEKLDQLNTTMMQAVTLLTEMRDVSKKTNRNINNMGNVF